MKINLLVEAMANNATGHAVLSPSASNRWLYCTASPAMSIGEPNTSSKAADRGTMLHELAEKCLLDGTNPNTGVEEDDAILQTYVDYVRGIEGELFVENRLSLLPITGEQAKGTADAIVIGDKKITVVDLKTGMTPVDAVNNSQLRIYALAALEEYSFFDDVQEVELVIVQPAIDNISKEVMSIEALQEFGLFVSAQAGKIHAGDVEFAPSQTACKYCPAKHKCPALSDYVNESLALDDLAESYKRISLVETWAAAIKDKTLETLIAGKPLNGLELTAGKKGRRNWTDEQAVIAALGDKASKFLTTSLISVAEIDKAVKKGELDAFTRQELEEFIAQNPAKPTIKIVEINHG